MIKTLSSVGARSSVLLGMTIVLSAGALAADPNLTIRQLHHTAWGPSQGAPLGGAEALAQTNDGYLWMAGPSGLFRFDGITFERIELPHDPKLSSLNLYSAFAPRSGGLWVGFRFGGVALLKGSHWQVYSVADGVPPGTAAQFAETPDGTLWVVTPSDLARFDGVRWKAVGEEMGLSTGVSPILFVDSQGTIWAGGGNSLFALRSGEHRFRSQPVAVPTPFTEEGMAESSAGTVWLDLGDELLPVAQNPLPVLPGRPSFGGPVFAHDGTLWEAAAGLNGLRRIAHPEQATLGAAVRVEHIADAYTDSDGLTSRSPFALLVDREGNVWVGTAQGLDRFSEPSLDVPLQSAQNLKIFPHMIVPGVVPADDAGGLWVTNGIDAVARYQDGRMSPPILRQQVECLLRTPDGTVWFGGRKALWRERQGHLESLAPPGPDREMQALALDRSGELWASVLGSGVFRLKDGVWTPYGGIAALPHETAITVVRDGRDRLWFSYLGGKVAVLDGDQVRIYGAEDGLKIGNVMANYPGRADQWLGGELGLARFDGQRFQDVRSGSELPLEGVTGIVETSDGGLWLNGRAGIVHLSATELERSRRDPTYPVRGETLGAFDGVAGSGAYLRPLPTAIQAGDGKLWFSTSGGIYGIDPARRAHNTVPPSVLLSALAIGDHALDPTPGLRLPVRTTAVRFDYIGLSLTAEDKVRYRYRLDNVDSDWRPLTASRQALYTNLRPGTYTFHVIAANNDGVWNDRGASLAFTIPPAFVQTWWFLVLCVAAGALAVWALVRLRVRQVAARLRGRLEERMAERERIARDLHDTLLQSTQGLIIRLQAEANRLSTGDPTRMALEDALDRAEETLAESRSRVLDLRASSDVPENLAEALAQVAREQPTSNEVELSTVTEETPRELNPAVADEIYAIGREALRNALQHSRATHIQVRLTYAKRCFGISIRDDGVGTAPELVEAGRSGHFGLTGMKERAAKIGARVEIVAAAPSGTLVTLTVPARTAYGPRGWLARLVDRWRSPPGSNAAQDDSVLRAQHVGGKSANG